MANWIKEKESTRGEFPGLPLINPFIAGSCGLVAIYCIPSRMPKWVWEPPVICCFHTTPDGSFKRMNHVAVENPNLDTLQKEFIEMTFDLEKKSMYTF